MFSLQNLPEIGRAVHELRSAPGGQGHVAFAVFLLAALGGTAPILWVGPSPDWYPPGLAWLGLDPARCIFAHARDDAESLGTLEAALRGGMAGVAECGALTRLAARRLALAARHGGGTGLLLRHAPAFTLTDSTAFATRWMIAPAQGGRLRAELLYAKAARPGVFMLDLKEAKHGATPPAIPVVPRRRAG